MHEPTLGTFSALSVKTVHLLSYLIRM